MIPKYISLVQSSLLNSKLIYSTLYKIVPLGYHMSKTDLLTPQNLFFTTQYMATPFFQFSDQKSKLILILFLTLHIQLYLKNIPRIQHFSQSPSHLQ